MNGNELIAQILVREGVEWLACFPSNPLIETAAQAGIRPVAFRHERGAVMAADGFSRVSNRKRFGVVLVQSQAGAENAMGGLAQAHGDNVPILMLPGGNALSFDWRLLAGRTWSRPWMLSGGLDADNLAEAVAATGARCVDVSSGVEDAPGVKSADKIAAFLAAAKAL